MMLHWMGFCLAVGALLCAGAVALEAALRTLRLPARWVIHTVGPVWQGGDHGEDSLLESCYRESLIIARDKELHTIAIPAVSTGVYRFPIPRAARVAAASVADFLSSIALPQRVMLVCFGHEAYTEYLTAVQERV